MGCSIIALKQDVTSNEIVLILIQLLSGDATNIHGQSTLELDKCDLLAPGGCYNSCLYRVFVSISAVGGNLIAINRLN